MQDECVLVVLTQRNKLGSGAEQPVGVPGALAAVQRRDHLGAVQEVLARGQCLPEHLGLWRPALSELVSFTLVPPFRSCW